MGLFFHTVAQLLASQLLWWVASPAPLRTPYPWESRKDWLGMATESIDWSGRVQRPFQPHRLNHLYTKTPQEGQAPIDSWGQ